MSNRKLEKLSNELDLIANDFANTYSKLIAKFKLYTTAPEIEQLCNFWDIAVGLLGKRGTILEMIDYFIKYQDLILSENVDEVLKMDFTKEIKPGTRDETTKIIVKLIDTFKSCWYKANTVNQVHIKTYIKLLTTKSIRMKQIVTEINNT